MDLVGDEAGSGLAVGLGAGSVATEAQPNS